jgi:hypothetical protein
MVMEKTGKVALTSYDLDQFSQGKVSQRLEELWGLTLDELKEIVSSRNYVRIDE